MAFAGRTVKITGQRLCPCCYTKPFKEHALRRQAGHAHRCVRGGGGDCQRFKVDMGTLYLDRIGELIAAALLNHLFTLNL